MDSREERLQQRLRGAQRRQVKDVDFDLVFPAAAAPVAAPPAIPLQPIPPNHQPPQPEVSEQVIASVQTSSNTTAVTQIAQENVSGGALHGSNDANTTANTSAKRRRLDTDDAPSSAVTTRSQIRRVDIYDLNLDEDEQENSIAEIALALLDEVTIPEVETEATPEPSILPPATTPEQLSTLHIQKQTLDEITESPMNAPGSGHRRRVVESSMSAGSRLQDAIESSMVEAESSSPIPQKKRKRGRVAPARPSPQLELSHTPRNPTTGPVDEAMDDDLDELSPDQPVKHKRVRIPHVSRSPELTHTPRNLSTGPTDNTTDDDLDELSPDQPAKRAKISSKVVEGPSPIFGSDDQDEAEAIGDEEAALLLKKNQGRRKSRRLPTESPVETAPEVPESPAHRKKGNLRNNPSPVRQSHPKKANIKSKPQSRKSSQKSNGRGGPPIPVTVRRLRGEVVYDEDELDADILNAEIPRNKRAGVNAIDVLSGLCGEIVGTGLQSLEDGGNACEEPILRREYKTKWNAVAAFGVELQTRLIEHTINLDNCYALDRRLRDEQKKKLSLREDILRVRAEREQIALRMDEVRMKHENEKTKAQDRDALNTAVQDIELAIDLGKTNQADSHVADMVGTELLLKKVASEVSSKGDFGGILKQIKDFNAFLERAALVLESRKV